MPREQFSNPGDAKQQNGLVGSSSKISSIHDGHDAASVDGEAKAVDIVAIVGSKESRNALVIASDAVHIQAKQSSHEHGSEEKVARIARPQVEHGLVGDFGDGSVVRQDISGGDANRVHEFS